MLLYYKAHYCNTRIHSPHALTRTHSRTTTLTHTHTHSHTHSHTLTPSATMHPTPPPASLTTRTHSHTHTHTLTHTHPICNHASNTPTSISSLECCTKNKSSFTSPLLMKCSSLGLPSTRVDRRLSLAATATVTPSHAHSTGQHSVLSTTMIRIRITSNHIGRGLKLLLTHSLTHSLLHSLTH
jgi:hypothetical protein